MLTGMAGGNSAAKPLLETPFIVITAAVVLGILTVHWAMRQRTLESVVARTPAVVLGAAWSLMLFLIVISQGTGNAFIYFQF